MLIRMLQKHSKITHSGRKRKCRNEYSLLMNQTFAIVSELKYSGLHIFQELQSFKISLH